MKVKIILASASKRRKHILENLGIKPTIRISNVEEINVERYSAKKNALLHSQNKARTIAKNAPKKSIIIAADTLVVFKKRILGKPGSIQEAEKMLRSFSGQKIKVYTGITVINNDSQKEASQTTCTHIRVRQLDKGLITKIIQIIDPLDRAGGFTIESIGAYAFDDIDGSFYNVLGLPPISLFETCKKVGFNLLDFI